MCKTCEAEGMVVYLIKLLKIILERKHIYRDLELVLNQNNNLNLKVQIVVIETWRTRWHKRRESKNILVFSSYIKEN